MRSVYSPWHTVLAIIVTVVVELMNSLCLGSCSLLLNVALPYFHAHSTFHGAFPTASGWGSGLLFSLYIARTSTVTCT